MQQSQPTCAPDGQAKVHLLPVGEFAVLGVNLFHHALQRIQFAVLGLNLFFFFTMPCSGCRSLCCTALLNGSLCN